MHLLFRYVSMSFQPLLMPIHFKVFGVVCCPSSVSGIARRFLYTSGVCKGVCISRDRDVRWCTHSPALCLFKLLLHEVTSCFLPAPSAVFSPWIMNRKLCICPCCFWDWNNSEIILITTPQSLYNLSHNYAHK